MPITAGPETVDTFANNGVASFFYERPVEVVNGTERWIFLLKTSGANWQIKAYLRNNVTFTWAEQDAGNGPLTSKTEAALQSPFACPSFLKDPATPTQVYIAYSRKTDCQLSFVRFNLTTRTFGVPVAGGPVVHGVDLNFAGPPAAVYNDDTGAKTMVGYRPSDNKLVFLFQGPPELAVAGADCLRPYFVTYDLTGAAWDASFDAGFAGVRNPFVVVGIVVDQVTSISYAICAKPNGGSNATTNEIWYIQLNANSSLNAPVMATNDVRRDREPYIGYPALQKLGGNTILNIAYISEDATHLQVNFQVRVARCLVAAAPAFVLEDVTAKGASDAPWGDPTIGPQVIIGDDDKPIVFWINAVSPDFSYRLWYSIGGAIAAAWAASVNFYTVADVLNDFMERPSVSLLPGL